MSISNHVVLDLGYLVSNNVGPTGSLISAGSPEKNHDIIENVTSSLHCIFLKNGSRCFGFDTIDKMFVLFLKQIKIMMRLKSSVHNTRLAF